MFNRIEINRAIYLTEPYGSEEDTITILVPDELQKHFFAVIDSDQSSPIRLIGDKEPKKLIGKINYADESGDHKVTDRRLIAEIRIEKE